MDEPAVKMDPAFEGFFLRFTDGKAKGWRELVRLRSSVAAAARNYREFHFPSVSLERGFRDLFDQVFAVTGRKRRPRKAGSNIEIGFYEGLLTSWEAGRGDYKLAIATYFFFYKYVAEPTYVNRITKSVFGEQFGLEDYLNGSPAPVEAFKDKSGKSKQIPIASTQKDEFSSEASGVPVHTEHLGQPVLTLWTAEKTEETRFLYRSRSIPYVPAEEAFEQLDHFVSCDDGFLWHVVHGPGGTGKSRLALEYAFERKDIFGDGIGFLSVDQAEDFDWQNWKPSRPTCIILDYAAREVTLVSRILRILCMRDDLDHKVRLLLLERDLTGAWFEKISHSGRSESIFVEKCWFAEDGELSVPDDVWPIVQHMCRKSPEVLPNRETALAELKRIDHHCRPLYAAFLGDAYRRGENPRNWDAFALVKDVLQHEKRYWEDGGVEQSHINLCAYATATGGVPSTWVERFAKDGFQSFWPQWQGNPTIEVLSSIYGPAMVDDVPPLEPDILGEVFFIEYWNSISRFERGNLLRYACNLAPWYCEFIERVVSDFPDHAPFELLSETLKTDFQEYFNIKYELIFNLVTNLARTYPKLALKVFWLIEKLKPNNLDDYAKECIVDSALNIIVGIPNLDFEAAFEVYNCQRGIFIGKENNSKLLTSRSGLALSFIAKFPQQEPQWFRGVLTDVLLLYRSNSEDEAIRQDTCIAIANFVSLMDNTHFQQVIKFVRLFAKLASGRHLDDMHTAWSNILYHLFLLHLIEIGGADEGNKLQVSKALAQTKLLVAETEQYEHEILEIFEEESQEQ